MEAKREHKVGDGCGGDFSGTMDVVVTMNVAWWVHRGACGAQPRWQTLGCFQQLRSRVCDIFSIHVLRCFLTKSAQGSPDREAKLHLDINLENKNGYTFIYLISVHRAPATRIDKSFVL